MYVSTRYCRAQTVSIFGLCTLQNEICVADTRGFRNRSILCFLTPAPACLFADLPTKPRRPARAATGREQQEATRSPCSTVYCCTTMCTLCATTGVHTATAATQHVGGAGRLAACLDFVHVQSVSSNAYSTSCANQGRRLTAD